MVEMYVSDFRLVWRCLIDHLRNVFDNTWMLATMSPFVVVDATRAARLLDTVLNVCPPRLYCFSHDAFPEGRLGRSV